MSVNDYVNKTADILCEFLEIAIHNILYIRKLYPQQIFKKATKYGTIVYQSVHPHVNEYITECLKAINYHLKSHCLKTVCLCVMIKQDILEKYVFDINYTKNINSTDLYLHLEQNFHNFCIKLQTVSNYLHTLPMESTFTIQACVTEYSSLEFNEKSQNDFPWIQVNSKNIPNTTILPVHLIDTNILKLQSYIESSINKR